MISLLVGMFAVYLFLGCLAAVACLPQLRGDPEPEKCFFAIVLFWGLWSIFD